jgi:hypothetical protein
MKDICYFLFLNYNYNNNNNNRNRISASFLFILILVLLNFQQVLLSSSKDNLKVDIKLDNNAKNLINNKHHPHHQKKVDNLSVSTTDSQVVVSSPSQIQTNNIREEEYQFRHQEEMVGPISRDL